MKAARSKQFKKGGAKSRSGSLNQDPVEVFCRVAPNNEETSYLTLVGDNIVQLSLPESAASYKNGSEGKDVRYSFKHVFSEHSSQCEVFEKVALHLVSQLVAGKNGLLLAYGVTGSGKTYTMTGNRQCAGIMPRCLDVIFQTIGRHQAKKCTFRPDRMNGFEILDDEEAMAVASRLETPAASAKIPKTPRRKEAEADVMFTQGFGANFDIPIDEDNLFSCFVSYIEIYNNYVFDLLDPTEDAITRKMQNRVLREDAYGNMYVHGVTEVEVKSPEEAFEVFSRGQGRKTVANTVLNNVSSRSHSIFTIRIVQAPLDETGDDVLLQQKLMTVSQLSLVDLAGSERTNRTKTTGQRLREAGNINFSLMTLRKCLEYLRENQTAGCNKMIPYRDSKLTHLFKNYFDGEGAVRMIVCVNPRASDCDETAQALKFAEATQEVQVSRPVPQRFEIGLTPGRRRQPLAPVEPSAIRPQLPIMPLFPNLMCLGPNDENSFLTLDQFLIERDSLRISTIADLKLAEEQLRKELLKIDDENRLGVTLREKLDLERQKVLSNEEKNARLTTENIDLTYKLASKDHETRNLEIKIEELERINKQLVLEKTKLKERYNQKNERLKKDKEELEEEYRKKDAAIYRVIDKVETPRIAPRPFRLKGAIDTPSTPCFTPSVNTQGTLYRPPTTSALRSTTAVYNPRHRRSKSAGGEDKWLDHRPAQPVPLATVFQPNMRRRKSVTKLTDKKDIVNSETTKYCLTTQEQDSEGTLETKLYKGDVVPTCTGGAQVILQDVESLRQISPRNVTVRKRSTPCEDTENRCRVAIEGHSKRPRS